MRKQIRTIGVFAAMAALLVTGCGSTSAEQSAEGSQKVQSAEADSENLTAEAVPLTYSFLYDEATREEVGTIMEADGVDAESVNQFMKIVTQFSDTLGEMQGAQEGFTTIEDASQPFYDSEYIGKTFDKELGFGDQNCRLTAYSLFHNLYSVSADSKFEYDDSLYGDMEILKLNTNLKFSDEDLVKYQTLFSDVKTEKTMDVSVHQKNIKNVWAERGITFDTAAKAQLITIMLNDPARNTLYTGHAGVLFETEEGYLLVEKLSQYTPFVAAKFEDLESLNTYLLSEVAMMQQDGAADSFVMRNDEPLL